MVYGVLMGYNRERGYIIGRGAEMVGNVGDRGSAIGI